MSDELDDIQAIFFEECAEGLATAETGLSAMNAGDVSPQVIAGVFRAVHSIKGGAGAFGHGALTAFAHRFENVLDEVRAGRIPPDAGVTRVMLSAFDILSDHVAAAQGTAPVPADAVVLAALDDILANGGAPSEAAPAPAPEPVVEVDPFGFEPVGVTLDDFEDEAAKPDWRVTFVPSDAALANGGEPLLIVRELESLGGEVIGVDTLPLPSLRDLNPEHAYFGWVMRLPAEVDEAQIADCFDFVAPSSTVEYVREGQAAVAPAANDDDDGMGFFEPVVVDFAIEAEEVPPAPSVETNVVPLPVAAAAPPPPAPSGGATVPETAQQTIRVDLHKLDMLLNLVGELVIRGSILADRLSPKDQERVELPQLSRLTREIQDTVMSLRAQPIKSAFSRVPRMLRDLSAETGKQVVLETTGETTEVDKGVIEKIGDPLTHMIRNAVDHGIETPEKREAAGKDPEGTIKLTAKHRSGRIVIELVDDGAGINRERVKQKAIDNDLISPDANLSDEEIDNLIFAPGFSTADQISDISGRGVGMDVVKRSIQALGGRISISSRPGLGSTFTMSLPLTLAVLDGMVVTVAGQTLVVPLTAIVETLQPEASSIHSFGANQRLISIRNSFCPLVDVGRILNFRAMQANPVEGVALLVESEGGGQRALMVDAIQGQRQVVIKSLEANYTHVPGIAAATILGDGRVALILDVDAVVAASRGQSMKQDGGLKSEMALAATG